MQHLSFRFACLTVCNESQGTLHYPILFALYDIVFVVFLRASIPVESRKQKQSHYLRSGLLQIVPSVTECPGRCRSPMLGDTIKRTKFR